MAGKKKKHAGGRPTKKDDETVTKLVEAFKRDYTVEEACAYAGIARNTFYRWLENDKKFSDKIESAKFFLYQAAKNTIAKKIVGDLKNNIPADDDLAKWFLERRAKKLYSLRQEVTGEDGDPLKIEWKETKTYKKDDTKRETNNSD